MRRAPTKPPAVTLKSESELALMRQAGRIVAEVLAGLSGRVAPGLTTEELDRTAREMTAEMGAIPSFKGYGGFPASVCVSVNDEVVHGVPGPRVLREGDLVSIDFGAIWQGWPSALA